jgi:U2-associated protein SR140
VAKKVRDNGKAFEEVLRQREKENPRFAFLTDEQVRVLSTVGGFLSSRN